MMEQTQRYNARLLAMEIAALLLALLFLVPFYFVVVNSLKSFGDLMRNAAGWPEAFRWDNYSKVWEIMKFPRAFMNSLLITVLSNAGLVLISAMAAYRILRRPTVFNRVLFVLFIAAMVIPFQSIMIPLVKVASEVGLMDSRFGLIICYFGFGVSLNLFLYHGFMKSIPLEIEEAAVVDGCTPYGVFWRIVFPLLKPMTITILILNSLWIWNDFLLPLLVLHSADIRTIPLQTYSFFGQYTKQWDLALAGLVLGVAPMVAFFLLMQKHIIAGISAGAVKG
ncbi:Putative starch degradation products transport system permease protein amyC [Thermobacillus xylanilyticus]|jgi:raffinose/stachyose/melibiose transport system permease protein|uniref:Starch degradation products transport system permease protein amyC n=2 Tax=Thermobacillus xylanilyticus TaxID=76633 RepID=A0ABM8V1V4_THEXY|nr:Putative starch degradation products transport system permease protein amyC [Thermobacillus xylanilyticus]